jgi:hypothetical protein
MSSSTGLNKDPDFYKNSKLRILDLWDKRMIESPGRSLDCKCGSQFEIYDLDLAGYKGAICKSCKKQSAIDTNIVIVLMEIDRANRGYNVLGDERGRQ